MMMVTIDSIKNMQEKDTMKKRMGEALVVLCLMLCMIMVGGFLNQSPDIIYHEDGTLLGRDLWHMDFIQQDFYVNEEKYQIYQFSMTGIDEKKLKLKFRLKKMQRNLNI